MNITLKLYGNLKRFSPQKREDLTLEISPGTTIADLFAQLGVPDSNVSMCAVNDVVVNPSTPLHDGDVVEVFEPVGGGGPSTAPPNLQTQIE
jgi:thiamine biosynthesis protein ThiS